MAGSAARDFEVREAINRVADASRKLLDTDARPVPRDQHPKQHRGICTPVCDRQKP